MNVLGRKTIRYNVIIVICLIVFIFIPSVYSLELYADVIIDVTDSGFVTIDGTTNHPNLLTADNQNYTSKTQDDWFLNIKKNEIFSEFVFKVLLPSGSSIYSVTSSGIVWIEEESNRLVIHGLGQNESFSLLVQYQITKSSGVKDPSFINSINIVFFIIIILLVFLIFLDIYRSRNKKQVADKTSVERIKGLTERQQKIMKLLNESSKPLTQTAIEKELNMPKAAVSRNIHSLERKGLIEIEKAGMSHFIRVKKS